MVHAGLVTFPVTNGSHFVSATQLQGPGFALSIRACGRAAEEPPMRELDMYVARWNGAVIAESDKTIEIEGNQYFPFDSVSTEYLVDSETTTTCSWKGLANYYSLKVDGDVNADAVWVYRDPKDAAREITNYVAFWRGVEVSKA